MSHSFEQQNLSEHNSLLESTVSILKDSLRNFANLPGFDEQMVLAFGDEIDVGSLEADWREGNIVLPDLEVVSSEAINGANGAFSSDTNTIYISAEFLAANQSDINAVNAVLLEEYGHYFDNKFNLVDSPGDEGAIFSTLVLGKELTDSELQQLGSEHDSAVVNIDGETIAIEQNIEDITLYSNSINFNEDNKFDINFQTADYINRWTGLNIPNNYTYSSGNQFVSRLNFGGDEYAVGGDLNLGLASLGARGGLRVDPGYFEAGLKVNAGYGLGEFDLDFGSLNALVDAGIENNKLKIDLDTNLTLPQLDYSSPYAYATLNAVLGYDFKVDGFFDGFAEIGVSETNNICGGGFFGQICNAVTSIVNYRYDPPEYSTNLINQQGSHSRRLVNLDTRSDNNYIDYIIGRINFDGKEGNVPRSRTEGYVGLNYELPSFENYFEPISLPNIEGDLSSISSPDDEYIWELSEETTLAEASFATDNLLSQIPFLAWLSRAGNIGFDIGGYGFGLEYDWRAIALDLSASLNFGYNFKLGVTDLVPQINPLDSEIPGLEFEFENVESIDDVIAELVKLDTDDGNDIDIYLEFDPTIIFEAEAYLRPEINFDWDIGVFDADLVVAGREYSGDFNVPGAGSENLGSTTIPIIPLTRREIKFSEIYRWLTGSEPTFNQYNLEIPFSNLDPGRFGGPGDDFFSGSSENNVIMAGGGNDRFLFNPGDYSFDGDGGTDAIVIDRPQTYSVTSNTINDLIGNQVTLNTTELIELAGSEAGAGINITGNSTPLEIVGIGTDFDDTIENITVQSLQSGGGNDVIQGVWSGTELDAGSGNDTITLTKATDASIDPLVIDTGAGNDTLNLTIIPFEEFEDFELSPSIFTIDLAAGNDLVNVTVAEPSDSAIFVTDSQINVSGYVGNKAIDLPLNNSEAFSEANLIIEASELRELFSIPEDADVDRLFVDIADSKINYAIDNTSAEAFTVQDEIIQADVVTLDIADPILPTSIQVDLENFNANTLNIEAHNSAFTEVVIDASNITDIPNTANLEVNGDYAVVKVEEQNETTVSFLENNLDGEFRTLDFSSIKGGVSLTNNFIPPDNADQLDVFELVFGDEADTVLFTPDSSFATEAGDDFNQELIGIENLMSFELGAGDDRFHDRPGTKNSEIYPGSGNDSIYGAGGYDTVRYPIGSRIDYEITVVDERTVEVYYRPEDTTDTLIDVEEIDFDGADEYVLNPFWQGPDINPDYSYTTFTLQVFESDDWDQPPFIYSPWSNLVPVGTTGVTLTEDFLLNNIYDPEGEAAELEISYIDVYAEGNSLNPTLDTTNPDADTWEVTIPEGLTNEEQAVIVDYMVDTPSGSSQGNSLYIYPSQEISYSSATEAINLTTSPESEFLAATAFDDVIAANDGNDTLEGLAGNDFLQGDEGDDNLDGGAGNDTLDGGLGEDTLIGHLEEGSDLYDGGAGTDLLSYETATISLSADLQTGLILAGEEEDILNNIENFLGSQAADTILGSEIANVLNGLAGNDSLAGRKGDDILEGREGNDTLNGGINNDQLIGGSGNDLLLGGADIDILEGNEGNDTLNGGGDSDLLRGGEGNDTYTLTLNTAMGDVIEDLGGNNDAIELLTAQNEPVIIAIEKPTASITGIARNETTLIIDLNGNGSINAESDLSILNYFDGNNAGDGFIEQVGNLSGDDILNFLA